MGTAQEDIIVNIKTVAELKQLGLLVNNLNKLKRAGVNVAGMEKNVNKRSKELGVNQKKLNTAFGGFQMELLGVMFFGMGLNKFLTGLLKPSFNLLGTFENLSLIMGAAFLPTALKINDALLDMGLKFFALPGPTREFYGDLIAVLAAMTGLLFLFGTFGLGLTSIAKAFGTTTGGVLLFGGQIIGATAALVILNKVMNDWDKLNLGTTTGIGLLAGGVGILAAALGANLFAAVLLVVAGVIALRQGFDLLHKMLEKSGVWEPYKEKIQTTIDKIKDIIARYKELKSIAEGRPYGGYVWEKGGAPSTPVPAGQGYGGSGLTTTTNAVEVTNNFNISGMVDMAGIRVQVDEIARQINESIQQEVASISRR